MGDKMSFQAISIPEPLLISPPLYPPLVLRSAKDGMFGAKRHGEGQWGPCGPCNRFEPAPANPHLHFELRSVIDPAPAQFWNDKNSIPLDPTRLLYRWEAQVLS